MIQDLSILQRTATTVTIYHTESVVGWDGYAEARDEDGTVVATASVTMGIGAATEVEVTWPSTETTGPPGVYPWSCVGVPPAGEPAEVASGRLTIRYNPTEV